jgi:hypothetical protein
LLNILLLEAGDQRRRFLERLGRFLHLGRQHVDPAGLRLAGVEGLLGSPLGGGDGVGAGEVVLPQRQRPEEEREGDGGDDPGASPERCRRIWSIMLPPRSRSP